MHLVQCKKCLTGTTITENDVDVHGAVDSAGCTCCPQDHHHGQAAGQPGAVPCRPLMITVLDVGGIAPAGGA